MKQTKNSTKQQRVYMIRTALVLITVAFLFGVIGGVGYFKSVAKNKIYTSNFMKVQFEYDRGFSIEEKLTDITLSKEGKMIRIGKYGTNFETALEHVVNLVQLNETHQPKIEKLQIGPYQVVKVTSIDEKEENRSYFIVKDFAVYFLSTNNLALFSDLDNIVKTFRILE